MAQGQGKLSAKGGGGGRRKSKAAQKKQAVKAKTATKNRRKHFSASRHVASRAAEEQTTKAINKKNESLIAAKAVGVGTKFFLGDITEKGSKELERQVKQRDKKQQGSKATDRLKDQLKKLGRDPE